MKYINIIFDYPHVIEKNHNLEIDPNIQSLWGTGIAEFYDDRFIYLQGWEIIVMAGNWYCNKEFVSQDGRFEVWRSKIPSKDFFDDFIQSNSEEEAEIKLNSYYQKIYEEILDKIRMRNEELSAQGKDLIAFNLVTNPTSWFTIGTCTQLSKHFKIPLVSTLHVDEEALQSMDAFKMPWKKLVLSKDYETKKVSDWVIAKNNIIHEKSLILNSNSSLILNEIKVPKINIQEIIREKERCVILYVWRISYEKWFDRLVLIIENLRKTGWEFDFHIFWSYLWWDDRLDEVFTRVQNYNNVHLHGFVWRESLFEYYSKAWILILPSRSEAFNQTILEAMYFWTYVLTTDVGWAKIQIPNDSFWKIISNELLEGEIINNMVEEIWILWRECTKIDPVGSHNYIKDFFASNLYKNKKLNLYNDIIVHNNKSFFDNESL